MACLDIVGFVTTQIHFHMTASKTRHQQTVLQLFLFILFIYYVAHIIQWTLPKVLHKQCNKTI